MNRIIIGIVAAIVIGVGVLVIADSSNNRPPVYSQNFATVQSDIGSGARLYDVRTASEYTAGHFKNAENWSLQNMQSGILPEIPKDTKLYVYCQSGNRSSQAAAILKQAGFTNVTDLGGLQDVQAIGGKITR